MTDLFRNAVFSVSSFRRRFRHWLNRQRGWIAEVHWFIQRGRRGYADCDIWSLDGYLARWMPSALRELQECGYPPDMTSAKWNAKLETMAMAFEEFGGDKVWDNSKAARKRASKGLHLFAKHFGHLWF